MKNLLIILLLLSVTVSCVTEKRCYRKFPPKEITKDSVNTQTYFIDRDSLVYIQPDSAWYWALIDCKKNADGIYKPVIVQSQTNNGTNVNLKPVFIHDTLKLVAEVDSQSIYLSWKEKHTETYSGHSETKVIKVNYLTGFQNFLCWSGGILWVVLILYFAYKIIKKYFKK